MFRHKLYAVKAKKVSDNFSRALVLNLALLLKLQSAHASLELSTLWLTHTTLLRGILDVACGRWWIYFRSWCIAPFVYHMRSHRSCDFYWSEMYSKMPLGVRRVCDICCIFCLGSEFGFFSFKLNVKIKCWPPCFEDWSQEMTSIALSLILIFRTYIFIWC